MRRLAFFVLLLFSHMSHCEHSINHLDREKQHQLSPPSATVLSSSVLGDAQTSLSSSVELFADLDNNGNGIVTEDEIKEVCAITSYLASDGSNI